METAVCSLERRNNDLLTWIEDILLKRLICLDKNSIFSADIPTDIGKQRNTLPKDTVWEDVEKSRILARLNGKLNSYYADDDDENLGNVWMSVLHPLDWNFCFGTIPRFREREHILKTRI